MMTQYVLITTTQMHFHEILDTQHKISEHSKNFTRQSKMLHSLYVRGRHNMINTTTATQKFNAIHLIIRVNATELYVYTLSNTQDLDYVIDEKVSAVLDKKSFL